MTVLPPCSCAPPRAGRPGAPGPALFAAGTATPRAAEVTCLAVKDERCAAPRLHGETGQIPPAGAEHDEPGPAARARAGGPCGSRSG